MEAVALLWRSRLRRQWRAWLAVAVLLGIGAGIGLACLAGARRTASSFARIVTVTGQSELTTSHGEAPDAARAVVDDFTGVAEQHTVVEFVGFVEGLDPTVIKYFVGGWDAPIRPLLRTGRLPDPARVDEVLVVGAGARKAGLAAGDRITMQLLGADDGEPVARPLTVTGTAAGQPA